MLKRIAITVLFGVSVAFGMSGPVAARTGTAVAKKGQKTVVAPVVPQGSCPPGMRC